MYNAMNPENYSRIVNLMRDYFLDKRGFIEVPAQSNLSILAACEDPKTLKSFELGGSEYPLPQTGQIVLEEVLLQNPDFKGVYCLTTSYREEPKPVLGRHDKIFPMFEFEGRGSLEDLKNTEKELLLYLGFEAPVSVDYDNCCKKYNAGILETEHEGLMQKDFGNSVSLEKFPLKSQPFWNMKYAGKGIFNKIDVILYGMETIGSAERSCDTAEMMNFFNSVSGGEYKKLLLDKFTDKIVMKELEAYLSLSMVPRYGAGIGITRMERAMKLAGLLK